jgi:hypothetical protein
MRGIGKDPFKSGFEVCKECFWDIDPEQNVSASPNRKKKRKDASKAKDAGTNQDAAKSKDLIMREQITKICEEYGMHAEFNSGLAFITTVAGEWFFAYNDRPIKLRHKNYELRAGRSAKSLNFYHDQNYTFPSPLHVLKYIYGHERDETERIMGRPLPAQTDVPAGACRSST